MVLPSTLDDEPWPATIRRTSPPIILPSNISQIPPTFVQSVSMTLSVFEFPSPNCVSAYASYPATLDLVTLHTTLSLSHSLTLSLTHSLTHSLSHSLSRHLSYEQGLKHIVDGHAVSAMSAVDVAGFIPSKKMRVALFLQKVRNNHLQEARSFLLGERGPCSPDEADEHGSTAIIIAAQNGFVSCPPLFSAFFAFSGCGF
jgi:hypothetical protein